jgi:signal transduction histidine kinase
MVTIVFVAIQSSDVRFGPTWSLVVFLLIVIAITPMVRDLAVRSLDHYLYRTRLNYGRTVKESSALLTRVHDINSLLEILAEHIARSISVEGVVVYACDAESTSMFALRSLGDRGFETPSTIPPLISQCLQVASRRPLEADFGPRGRSGPLRALLDELNWALVLPLLSDDTVIGAIALGPKLSGDPYYPQDLDLLATLANQAGIAVKNAQLYAEVVLANEYVENIVATINSGVVAVSPGGRITLFNRAAEHLTGLAASSVRLAPTSALPACLAAPLTQTVAEGRAITYPEIMLPDGATGHPVLCTVSPLRDTAGSILGGVAVFSDLTPLKELEIERRRAEKLDYFKLLASGFAHEIKNPLVSIKTFVQLVPLRLDDRRWLEDFSRVVHREIERIERLLQRLASLGSAHQRPQSAVDLRQPVREAIELLKPEFAERRIRVDARLGEQPTGVLGDHDELKQLAHNLLLNALQHTPVDGGVTVEVGAAQDRAALAVTDTGPGIAPGMLESIFDPFVTTRSHGTGLGLAICAGIATAHRARIHGANRAGGGAAFTVEFPLVTSVPATVSA